MINLEELKKYKHIHMLGIGGTSMSGIATILKKWGFYVTGSDANESELVDKLKNNGISVVIGHDLDNLRKADLVIYSAAISHDDIEMQEAERLNIETMERSTFLGIITKGYRDTISISGTHGKTTTTSMISVCFMEAHKDPTVQVGAILKQIDGNYRVGNSEYFILESCEYVESFLKFHPRTEVILNIDNDHLDYFKDLEHIKNAFVKFVELLPKDGLLVLNADDPNCVRMQKLLLLVLKMRNQTLLLEISLLTTMAFLFLMYTEIILFIRASSFPYQECIMFMMLLLVLRHVMNMV